MESNKEASHWYDPMRSIASLGSQAPRPGSLGGLAEARRIHKGQFFTPDALALFCWNIAKPAMDRAVAASNGMRRIAVLDNAVGSGRLLQYASPEQHALYGADVDTESVKALGEAAAGGEFSYEFKACGMENLKVSGCSVAIINPPFSLHLESPNLFPHPCTTWGRYGRHTSTLSHSYALYQALDAARIVVAILPSTFAAEFVAAKESVSRLRAQYRLPAGSFREEGTEVSVDVLVFDSVACKSRFEVIDVASLDDAPADLGLTCPTEDKPRIAQKGITDDAPAVTLPITGNTMVRVVHDGRRIKLQFQCGLVQAKVLNAVYQKRVEYMEGHRHPVGLAYTGQGQLDVEIHLAQPDPMYSFETLIATIANAGGEPVVDRGLIGYLKRAIRKSARQKTPFRHDVQSTKGAGSNDTVTGRARKSHSVNPKLWGSPAVMAGQEVRFTKVEGSYHYEVKGHRCELTEDELYQRFELDAADVMAGWTTVHPGLLKAFPNEAGGWEAIAKKLGITDWLSWKYQARDLVEMMLKPSGAICCWEMGLGKARLAVALCLLSGSKHNLIAVEAYALPETRAELESLPIDRSEWQVIDSVDKLGSLKKINLISITRLRMAVSELHPKITYAKRLRRRIGVLCVDEGHFLANMDTSQSQACFAVCAKKRYLTTGTPVPNYPRNILPLLRFVAGDGTAAQPYGMRRAYIEPNLIRSMQYARRGVEQFMDDFVTLEWVTSEFAEDLRNGAKREVPKIGNLDKYRAMLAPQLKRRLDCEPDVTPYVKIPKPTEGVIEVDWDEGHLAHYLKVSEEFAHWFLKARDDRKKSSLIALLARIGAVEIAGNYPQHADAMFRYGALTSKQRAALDWLEERTEAGDRSILFAQNPGNLDMLGEQLAKRGIESVVFHGGIPVEKRCAELNERYRFGPVPVLLASYGVTQSSLNIWQANAVLLYNRDWAWKTEAQAIRRVCRPQQTRQIRVDALHLPGSIDEYQAQMVAFKKEAAVTGVDWAAPTLEDVEFLHLDTVLGRFCEDLAKLRGVKRHQLRDTLGSRQFSLEGI